MGLRTPARSMAVTMGGRLALRSATMRARDRNAVVSVWLVSLWITLAAATKTNWAEIGATLEADWPGSLPPIPAQPMDISAYTPVAIQGGFQVRADPHPQS